MVNNFFIHKFLLSLYLFCRREREPSGFRYAGLIPCAVTIILNNRINNVILMPDYLRKIVVKLSDVN